MRSWFCRVLISIAAAVAPDLALGATDSPRVALIVSLVPDAVSVPAVELYRAVADAAERSGGFRADRAAEVKDTLTAPAALRGLGAIPAFDRRGFAAARAERTVIPPVQAMLDTLALDGAVIVDCRPRQDHGEPSTMAVTGCGLYYYDRALGRVLAAATKDFRVGVTDASRWAPELLASLSQGLQAYATNAERERVRAALAEHADEGTPRELLTELRLDGTNLADPSHRVSSAPLASLAIGQRWKGYVTGLELGMGEAATGLPGGSVALASRHAGLFVSAETHALESVIWDLRLGAAYTDTVATSDGPSAGDGRLETRAVALSVMPGLLWQLSKSVEWGAGISVYRFVPVAEAATGAYVGRTFSESAVGLGIRLRALL